MELRCTHHPEETGLAMCTRCTQFICAECHHIDRDGLAICPSCIEQVMEQGDPSELERLTIEVSHAELNHGQPIPLEDASSPDSWVERFVSTVQLVLFDPVRFFSQLSGSSALREPLLFGFVCTLMGMAMAAVWSIVLGGPEDQALQELAVTQGVDVGVLKMLRLMMVPLTATIHLVLGTLLLHAAVLLVGGSAQARETFQIFAYGAAAQLLLVVPVIGVMATLMFQVFVQFAGLRILHGLSPGRAAVACVIPMGLLIILQAGV